MAVGCSFRHITRKTTRQEVVFLRGSVTVVALVAVTLLFLLSMVVATLVQMGFLQTERSAQKARTRWFLEGEVARWFALREKGEIEREGRWQLVSSNGHVRGELVWKIGLTNWILYARGGEGISRAEIHLEGWVLPFASTTIFWVFPVELEMRAPWHVKGDMAFAPASTFRTNTYGFVCDGRVICGSSNGCEVASERREVLSMFWEKPFVWEDIFFQAKEKSEHLWRISSEEMWRTKDIVNPLFPSKILLGWGGGTFPLSFEWNERQNVYVRKKDSTSGKWSDYLYYRGPQKKGVFRFSEEKIVLALSANPYLKEESARVELPQEAWEKFGEICLEGKEISLISRDEEVAAIRFGNNEYYFAESDFFYDRQTKTIRLFAQEFFRRHSVEVATADGRQREYTLPLARGNFFVYVDEKRVWNYRRTATRIIFDAVPSVGSRIRLLRDVDSMVIYKKPPTSDGGLFGEWVDRCVVIDLDALDNFPSKGIIYSSLPLVVKGTAREPLCIVSERSLYVEDMNSEGGEVVGLVGKEGVWLLQEGSMPRTLRHVVIISPLPGLYSIGDAFVPATVEGKAIFSAFGQTKSLDGFMEHNYISSRVSLERVPLLASFPQPMGVYRLWRR